MHELPKTYETKRRFSWLRYKDGEKHIGALKYHTKIGLDFKDVDVAIVKATNHFECQPKDRHIDIFEVVASFLPGESYASYSSTQETLISLLLSVIKTTKFQVLCKVIAMLQNQSKGLEESIARLACSGSSIYKALRCKEPTSIELLSYMHLLYEICPYFKFGYLSANGAIVDAKKDERTIHIIDFQIAQGSQWITLIHALAAWPGGPPHTCITGIDGSTSAYAIGGGLEIVSRRLSSIASSCNVPFEFHPVAASCFDIEIEHLNILHGEPLAVNFALILRHMPDGSAGTENHRDRTLRMIKSLSPKIVTLVEQESKSNKTKSTSNLAN